VHGETRPYKYIDLHRQYKAVTSDDDERYTATLRFHEIRDVTTDKIQL
jgi:hypothetical protein